MNGKVFFIVAACSFATVGVARPTRSDTPTLDLSGAKAKVNGKDVGKVSSMRIQAGEGIFVSVKKPTIVIAEAVDDAHQQSTYVSQGEGVARYLVEPPDARDFLLKTFPSEQAMAHNEPAFAVLVRVGSPGETVNGFDPRPTVMVSSTGITVNGRSIEDSKPRALRLTHDGYVQVLVPSGAVVDARSLADSTKVKKYGPAGSGDATYLVQSPDGNDFTLRIYDTSTTETADEAKLILTVNVAQPKIIGGIALTGIGLRAASAANGYTLKPFYTQTTTNGITTSTLAGQRITATYPDTFDLNFSAGLQFVSAEDSTDLMWLERILGLGLYVPGHNRIGYMLSINQPTSGNPSFRVGPIIYFSRSMETAITYGLEAYQGDRLVAPFTFGQVIGPMASVDTNAVTKRWFTSLYLGFVYKIGK